MPQLELNTMIYLMNTVHFRTLPLYCDLSHNDLLSRYPLLISIRGENADEDCERLASKFGKALNKTMQIVNISVETQSRPLPTPNVNNIENVEDVGHMLYVLKVLYVRLLAIFRSASVFYPFTIISKT
jgi:hypothetical protein